MKPQLLPTMDNIHKPAMTYKQQTKYSCKSIKYNLATST